MTQWPGSGGPAGWSRQWWEVWTSAADAASPLGRAVASPFDPLKILFDAARTKLIGEERTYRIGGRDLTMTLDELTLGGMEVGRRLGQYGDVRLTARDLRLAGDRADQLEVVARNVHLSLAAGLPILTAAPVSWKLTVPTSAVAEWVSRSVPGVVLGFLGGEVVLRHRTRGRQFRLAVAPFAEGRSVRLVPRGLVVGTRRVRLRLPSYNVALPALPESDWLTGLSVDAERVVISGMRAEWRRALTRNDVDRLVRTIRDKVRRLDF